jgi:signal peptidase I
VETKPRNPLIAGVLSLIHPGFGWLYLGRPKLALALGLSWPLVAVGEAAAAYRPELLRPYVLLVVVLTALYAGQLLAAVVVAIIERSRYVLRPCNTARAYWMFFLLLAVPSRVVAQLERALIVEPFQLPSSSMAPSLLAGEQLFALKRAEVKRGDAVVYRHDNKAFVKRVIAVGGDHIDVGAREVRVNGELLASTFTADCPIDDQDWLSGAWSVTNAHCYEERQGDRVRSIALLDRVPPADDVSLDVPAGQLFLLGDNRDNSMDSRREGPYEASSVVGRVSGVWLSWGPRGLRLDRIGARP